MNISNRLVSVLEASYGGKLFKLPSSFLVSIEVERPITHTQITR